MSDDDRMFLLGLVPYSLVAAALAIGHALAVKWLLSPLPPLADHASRGVVVVWIVAAGWYGEAVIRAVVRREAP